MRTLLPLALIALTGCGWNLPDGRYIDTVAPLWDNTGIVPAADGLYVRLPRSGRVARVTPDGATLVETGGGEVSRLALAPDGETVVAFVRHTVCDPPDPRDARGIKLVSECPSQWREVSTEVTSLVDGAVDLRVEVGTHLNEITFSRDGRWAIAWLDLDGDIDLTQTGVVDLTSVLVLDLANGDATPVSVGFAAENILFTEDGSRAVVLSKDSVVLVSLDTERPDRGTVYPLTLDADQEVVPVGVELTPDGRYALITASGRDDLYALRLERPSINLVNLSGTPSAMAVVQPSNPDGDRATDPLARDDRTVIVHSNASQVDIMEHDQFDVDSIDLDESMNHIQILDRRTVLWGSQGQHDAYELDVSTGELVEFRLENPPFDLQIAPGGNFAIALTRAEGGVGQGTTGLYDRSPGLEIMDLRDGRGRTAPFLLEQPAVGMAFSPTDTRLDVLVLQQGIDYLYQLDLLTLTDTEIELSAPPAALGALPAGGFWIAHNAALGLITFYDPTTGESTEVAGFGALGWLDGIELDTAEEE